MTIRSDARISAECAAGSAERAARTIRSRVIVLVSLLGLVGFGAIAVGLLEENTRVEQHRESSERGFAHSQDVLVSTQRTLSALQDTETEQRGYLLSLRTDDREPYSKSRDRVELEIAQLASLTADNARQQQRVARLKVLAGSELDALVQAAAVAQIGRSDPSATIVAASRGQALMDKARALIGEMQAEELPLLARRRANLQAVIHEESVLAIRAGVFGLVLLISAALLMVALLHAAARSRRVAQRLRTAIAAARYEARYRRFIDDSPVALAMYDTHMRYLAVSRQWLHDYGLEGQAVLGRSQYEVLPEIPEAWREANRRALAGEAIRSEEVRFERRDGATQWLRRELRPWHNLDGTIGGVIIFSEDITERKRAEEQRSIAALVYQASSEAMAVIDAQGRILDVNPAFTKLTGYSAEEAVGIDFLRLSHGAGQSHEKLRSSLVATGCWKGELWNWRKDGTLFAVSMSINSVVGRDGNVERRVAQFTDITEQKLSAETIWRQANLDDLTGLPNRRMFRDRLEQEIKRSRRSKLPVALMLIDIDRFKEVNDTLGHEIGDALLAEVARRLRRCVRECDTVARLGGDEFTLILGALSDVRAVDRVARQVLERLAAPFRLAGVCASVSGSIGVALYPTDGAEAEQLMRNADRAMYESKFSGGNRVSYVKASIQAQPRNRLQIGSDLRRAL